MDCVLALVEINSYFAKLEGLACAACAKTNQANQARVRWPAAWMAEWTCDASTNGNGTWCDRSAVSDKIPAACVSRSSHGRSHDRCFFFASRTIYNNVDPEALDLVSSLPCAQNEDKPCKQSKLAALPWKSDLGTSAMARRSEHGGGPQQHGGDTRRTVTVFDSLYDNL